MDPVLLYEGIRQDVVVFLSLALSTCVDEQFIVQKKDIEFSEVALVGLHVYLTLKLTDAEFDRADGDAESIVQVVASRDHSFVQGNHIS